MTWGTESGESTDETITMVLVMNDESLNQGSDSGDEEEGRDVWRAI